MCPGWAEIRRRGTPDIEFAVTGLLIRSQISGGQVEDARRTAENLRTYFIEERLTRFLPNMDALRCRIDLYGGDLDSADAWYREKAPRDPLHLDVMKRYQYMTQAMVELTGGKPEAALLTLAPLVDYCRRCQAAYRWHSSGRAAGGSSVATAGCPLESTSHRSAGLRGKL